MKEGMEGSQSAELLRSIIQEEFAKHAQLTAQLFKDLQESLEKLANDGRSRDKVISVKEAKDRVEKQEDSPSGSQHDSNGKDMRITLAPRGTTSGRHSFVRAELHSYRQRVDSAGRELAEARNIASVGGRKEKCRETCQYIVRSKAFSYYVMLVIAANLVCMGVEVETTARLPEKDAPVFFTVANCFFVCNFVLEAVLRLGADGPEFFYGNQHGWNIFDFGVMLLSVFELSVDLWSLSTSSTAASANQVGFVRVMRVARALRGIRVMRLLRFVHALRTLVLSIMSSIASLLWTAVLFLLLFYSFGVIFTQLVTDWCRDEAIADRNNINAIPDCPNDLRWFETVPQSMLTLFLIISDGLDWDTVLNPLQQASPVAAAFLMFYVIITVFAVVNVVNGVFVNTAVETAMHDKDVASMKQLQLQESIVQTLKQVFEEIDANGTCLVSLEDIEVAMETRKLGGFLESMGISTQDMITLFMILDADKSGLLDLDEFVTGCMQLHGPAKSLQVAKMSHENKVTRQQLWQLRTAVVQMDIKLDKVLSECLVSL